MSDLLSSSPLLKFLRSLTSFVYASLSRLVVRDLPASFDADYYLERYPDVRRSGLDPLAHFLWYGAREGRQPQPWFDIRYYTASNPDVAAAGANPLVHFLRYGWQEGRRPNPLFDASFYAAQSPRLPRDRNPFVDFVERRRKGERVRGALPFTLPSDSYQVATSGTVANNSSVARESAGRQPARRFTTCPTVDVVIPVYAGLEETRRCIASVLGSACQTAYEVILINDRTPDPALARYLQEAAATHGLTLLENSENLGFAGSVNRGMELHPDRDVVLLNSDTEVANDWLDRLAPAAGGQSGDLPHIGTVTPFSNHATICSYPKPEGGNRLPDGWTVAALDEVFRQANAGHRIPIPTAVGFCRYIRRECLTDVGLFRPEVFGKGYGEENDFCMRSLYKGWSHVLATDVFVYHAGETSFAGESESRRQAARETLGHLYPEYARMIAGHMRSDPAKAYRIAVSGWRMRHAGKPVILAVSHELGGGVAQYLAELREAVAGRAAMLLLTPSSYGAVVVRNLDPDDDFTVVLDVELDYTRLLDLLRYCGVTRMHVQHMAGFGSSGQSWDIERLRQDLGVPADVTVHDYAVICPQVTLTDAAGRYCGEPDAAGCNACLAARPPWPVLDIAGWRKKYAPLVTHADRVIAPSRDAAERMRRYFPEVPMVVAGHVGTLERASSEARESAGNQPARRIPSCPTEPLVIAVLGVMNLHKGILRLRACAGEAERRGLPLRFVLAGYEDTDRLKSVTQVKQTGPYRNEELPGLLQEMGAQVVWFPAQWPETFSYTLSVCLELGMPVVAPDIGAFPERLAGRSWSWIVPWDWDTGRMLEFFLSIRQDHFLPGIAPAVREPEGRSAAGDFYPVEYLR